MDVGGLAASVYIGSMDLTPKRPTRQHTNATDRGSFKLMQLWDRPVSLLAFILTASPALGLVPQ